MQLFLARGASARAGAGAAPVAVVARICRELDGLPLAIELAAARASVLSAEEIAAHLADKFRFLARRRPVADPRHQTLTAAIGWSYDLLPAEERRAFRALSVFAGGFSLAAVAAVCCGGDQVAALDLVEQLAGKSLVVAEPAAGGTRYRVLETIRQYAAERLDEAGEAGPARRRHAEAFLRLAEEERALPVLLREQDNFRAALDHALAGGDALGPRLARALGGFWQARGLLQEARGWLERALAAGPADQQLRADLHRLLGAVLYAAGDLERARDILAQGSQAAATAGLVPAQARIRALRAEIQATQDGNLARAIEACEQAAAVLESEGDLEGLAEAWLSAGRLRFWAAAPRSIRSPRARRRLRPAKRQPPRRAGIQNLAGGYPLGPAYPGRRGGRPGRAVAGSGLRRPVGGGGDTRAALADLRLRWPIRRRPRSQPASPVHTHCGRGETRPGAVRTAGRPDRADGRGPRRGRADPARRV